MLTYAPDLGMMTHPFGVGMTHAPDMGMLTYASDLGMMTHPFGVGMLTHAHDMGIYVTDVGMMTQCMSLTWE